MLETFRDGFPVKLTGKSKSLALEGTVLFLIVFTRMGHCEKASLAPSHYVTPSPTSTVIPSAVRPSQEIEQRGRSATDVQPLLPLQDLVVVLSCLSIHLAPALGLSEGHCFFLSVFSLTY